MNTRIGNSTLEFDNVGIVSFSSSVGKKEGDGPLKDYFDKIFEDDYIGEDSWEKAERELQKVTARNALSKAMMSNSDIDMVFAGDLINQCVSANYAMKEFNTPFFGLYGACSTMAESLILASMSIASGYSKTAMCVTSSHFCSSEKQFRFPLEYGGQRTPTSQWTVTGSGATVLSNTIEDCPKIKRATVGKIVDMGIKDINNMGAAMAPAAVSTLKNFFEDTNTTPQDYDMILTGDLGVVGSSLLCEIMDKEGYNIYEKHNDCGKMIFDIEAQDVHAGGSGCGCGASVLNSYVLKNMVEKKLKKVIFTATGALMNPTTVFQGDSIPGIAHLVYIEV